MPHFAAEIRGLDLRFPLEDATLAELRETIHRYAVVVLRDQAIDDEQQVRFSERFGELEAVYALKYEKAVMNRNVIVLSNLDPETGAIVPLSEERAHFHDANRLWHSDSSFKPVPAAFSILSARRVPPEGADTEYADTRVAWNELPPAKQATLEGLVVEHDFLYGRSIANPGNSFFTEEEKKLLAPVRHPLIRRHPAAGTKSVYIGSHASRILGMPLEEGRAILRELLERATLPERVYRHKWRANDLVIWDNPSVIHRGTPFDAGRHARVMHRTTVIGEPTM